MIIALDYDDTYTLDPEFWDYFILSALRKNYTVLCVTMRYPHEGAEVEKQIGKYCKVIYTCRKAKQPYLADLSIFPDVWIDDRPDWIFTDAR